MNREMLNLTQDFKKNSPASMAMIETTQKELGLNLPPQYIEWLCHSNGASGIVGRDSYLQLWPIEKLIPLNRAYQVEKFAPGLLLFGSDGGGEGYAFDTRFFTFPIVQIPFVGMNLEEVRPLGNTFLDFLRHFNQ